nr:uncharacterized protein LOC129284253 [Lytechinus pictus]
MSMGYAITGKGLTHLARLPCLEILILGGLLKLTNDGLESLGKRGLLRTLFIRGNTRCDDGGFYHIAMNCSHLKLIDICYMSSITSATLKALIEARAMRDDEYKSPTLQIFAEGILHFPFLVSFSDINFIMD